MSQDCVDMARVMPVLLEYFDRHTPEELVGQTLAIHFALIPELYDATRVPFQLTIRWIVLQGNGSSPTIKSSSGRS